MINRRQFLAASAAVAASGASSARNPQAVDVVMLLSFSCSFCYAAEAHSRMISLAAVKTGGRLVHAPIPLEEGASGWRERTYYAARDIDPLFGETVKQSVYRGVQESEVSLNDPTQLYYWFMQDIPKHEARFNRLFDAARAPAAVEALSRAARLVRSSGATQLPTYVLLVNGSILGTLDSSNSQGTSMSALRDDVLTRIEKLSTEKL